MIYDFLVSICGNGASAEVLSAASAVIAIVLVASAISVLWNAFHMLFTIRR